jgi:REP element-mobilizing transposase RayT
MPRPLRVAYPNAWYHVFNRSNARKTICFSEYHFHEFLGLLSEIVEIYEVEIHSFCLMKNHYHLLMKTPKGNISKAMWYFGYRFAKILNTDINADGPVFKDRFRALLIDNTRYLLQVSRYIHLNPVEAQIVAFPEQYPWSSYSQFLTRKKIFDFLKIDFLLDCFLNPQEYRDFVSLGIDAKTRDFYKKKNCRSVVELS